MQKKKCECEVRISLFNCFKLSVPNKSIRKLKSNGNISICCTGRNRPLAAISDLQSSRMFSIEEPRWDKWPARQNFIKLYHCKFIAKHQ